MFKILGIFEIKIVKKFVCFWWLCALFKSWQESKFKIENILKNSIFFAVDGRLYR